MKFLCLMKKAMCFGKLIWLKSPGRSFDKLLAQRALNHIGIMDSEIQFLKAVQFIKKTNEQYSLEVIKAPRVVLVVGLDELSDDEWSVFEQKIVNFKVFKNLFDVNLIVVLSHHSKRAEFLNDGVNDKWICGISLGKKQDADEVVHEMIEVASMAMGKPILSLSVEIAEQFEWIFNYQDQSALRIAIYRSIANSKNKKLVFNDLLPCPVGAPTLI